MSPIFKFVSPFTFSFPTSSDKEDTTSSGWLITVPYPTIELFPWAPWSKPKHFAPASQMKSSSLGWEIIVAKTVSAQSLILALFIDNCILSKKT